MTDHLIYFFSLRVDCEDDGDSDFDATDTWDPMAIDYYSPNNNVALNTENYDSVTTGYIPKDEERICRFFRASGTCYKGDFIFKCHHRHHFLKNRIPFSLPVQVFGVTICI